jgi:hypothetical protein
MAGEQLGDRGANRLVRQRSGRKCDPGFGRSAKADGVVEGGKCEALRAGKRTNLFRQPCELGRIDAGDVAAIRSRSLFGNVEQRQPARRLKFSQQRFELQFAVKRKEFGVGRRFVTASLPLDAKRQIAPNR